MSLDLVQIRTQAREKEDENYRFRLFLKGECHLEPEEIDEHVFAATHRIWPGLIAPNVPSAAGKCIRPSPKRKLTGCRAVSP